jgi:lipopolysaccharide biosynthesis glycosyltransferase
MEKVNIAFCFNDGYTSRIAVTITSILINNENLYFDFYLFSSDLSNESIKLLDCLSTSYNNFKLHHINVDKNIFSRLVLPIRRITVDTYFRYVIPELLPNVDKILYLDGDLVVNGCIYNFYDIKLENNYFAGVKDMGIDIGYQRRFNLDVYVNAGVLLMNLKQMRQDHIYEKLINTTIKLAKSLQYPDQDVLNVVCKDRIVLVDSIYNFITPNMIKEKERRDMAVIIHYTGMNKPWNTTAPMYEIWNQYNSVFNKILTSSNLIMN